MRGPEGPVRGGVTRCGRPPPRRRGRGRGKTSHLSTPSSSKLAFPWTVATRTILSISPRSTAMFVVSRRPIRSSIRTSLLFGRKATVAGIPVSRLPEVVSIRNRKTTVRGDRKGDVISMKKEDSGKKQVVDDGMTPKRRELSRRSSSFLDYCADTGAQVGPRLLSVARSTALGQSELDTVLCAASRPDRRRRSRPTTVYRTPHHPLGHSDTCHRSRQRRGVVPNSLTRCHPRVRKGRRNRMPPCQGLDAHTSRG